MADFDLSKMIITDIKSVVKTKADMEVPILRSNRTCFAIDVKVDGSTTFVQNGNAFLLDKNHVLLLPKDSSYLWTSHGGECLIVDFEGTLKLDTIQSYSVKDATEIHNLMVKLHSEYLRNGASLTCYSTLYKILQVLVDGKKKDYAFSSKEKQIEPGVKYIRTNYMNPDLSSKMLSDLCGISEVYFRKIFTEVYKESPMQYLQNYRMKKAEEMLLTDYTSIHQIAEACGYTSLFHFSKMFKKTYGIAPSKMKGK